MARSRRLLVSLMLLLLASLTARADQNTDPATPDNETALENSSEQPTESAIEERRKLEKKIAGNRFGIIPYKQNYLLPLTYNTTVNRDPYLTTNPDVDLSPTEVKFQFSFKTPLWERIVAGRGTLFGSYTQQSYWQAYNATNSSPFRETNYQPELFLAFDNDMPFLGVHNRMIVFGIEHQSNGRSEPLSRSWNRLYTLLAFEKGNLYFAIRPWYRLPESRSSDDNPDIQKYMGHGEFYAVYTAGKHRFGIMVRNNLRSDNRGAVQLDWSFPLHPKFDGYIQYFNGYGESLIDYDHTTNRIGLGIIIANWL